MNDRTTKPQTIRTVKNQDCPECGYPGMFTELDTSKLIGGPQSLASATYAMGCSKCGLYRTDVARFIAEVNILHSLSSEEGAGSDLTSSEDRGDDGLGLLVKGRIDIDSLVGDILALGYALMSYYPEQILADLDRDGRVKRESQIDSGERSEGSAD